MSYLGAGSMSGMPFSKVLWEADPDGRGGMLAPRDEYDGEAVDLLRAFRDAGAETDDSDVVRSYRGDLAQLSSDEADTIIAAGRAVVVPA